MNGDDTALAEAIIEVSIPRSCFEHRAIAECSICLTSVCDDDGRACRHAPAHLTCCGQSICCGCLVKLLRRCRCADDCAAVVGTCPFCREMCRAETVSVFLGHQSACRACIRK
jgi:hypothetical protein